MSPRPIQTVKNFLLKTEQKNFLWVPEKGGEIDTSTMPFSLTGVSCEKIKTQFVPVCFVYR